MKTLLTLVVVFIVLVIYPCLAQTSIEPESTSTSTIQGTTSLGIENFEEATIPGGWKLDGQGKMALVTDRYKSGAQSLAWNWAKSNTTLTFHDPIIFAKHNANSTAGLWVYNEKPIAGKMVADLLNGNVVVGSVWFWMDYKGWRPLGALYQSFGVTPLQTIDGIRFHAPEGISSGRLYLDYAKFNFSTNNKKIYTTYQMPWWKDSTNASADPRSVVLSDADITENRPWLPAKTSRVSPQERADMDTLSQRILPPLVRSHKGLAPGVLDKIRQQMMTYKIVRVGNTVTGRPIENGSLVLVADSIDIFVYMKFCQQVQQAFALAKDTSDILELKTMFVNLAAHLVDQGWEEGSLLGAWGNYPGDGLLSFPLMRDVLAEAGLLRPVALGLAYHIACQTKGDYFMEKPWASMDGYGYWSNQLLPCLLMLPDEAERMQHVRTVQRFYSLALTNPTSIGPDGCAYHHGAFHFAYSNYDLHLMLRLVEKMRGTQFRISAAAQERLKTYAHAIAFTLCSGQQAPNLAARAGSPLGGNMALFAELLANMGSSDGKEKLDTDMVRLSLNQTKDFSKEPAKSWIALGIKPLVLTGHLTMNGSPLAVHRRDNWMVSIAGMSPFYRGLEIYGWTRANNYGRFARNGTIFVTSSGTPPSLLASGWDKMGLDWFHFPGATNVVLSQQDIFDGYGLYGSGGSCAGGNQLDQDGIWGMDFGGTSDTHFKRSIFCFDNRITVLTSNIHSTTNAPMVTTLFQNTMQQGKDTVMLDGNPLNGFPIKNQLAGARAHWLIDNKGTGYIIPAGNDSMEVSCATQQWTYLYPEFVIDSAKHPELLNLDYMHFSKKRDMVAFAQQYRPTKNDFATAWFSHGNKPTDAACAYTVVVKTTPENMKALLKNPPFKIISQTTTIHAVYDIASHTTGYALFAANDTIHVAGMLLANNQPCFAMIRSTSNNTLQLSIARTDIKRTDAVHLKLKGAWKMHGQHSSAVNIMPAGGNTELDITPDYYMPFILEMDAVR